MARLTLSTLFAATLATSALAWTPEVVTTANLGGSVTAISLANAVGGGGPKSSILLPIDTVEACLKGCADFRNGLGCNTVNFCNNANGCGSGCNQRELGPYGTLQCTSDGKFPYKTCSLKWNDDINNPVIYEEGSGDWLAATTSKGFPRQTYG